MTRFPVKLKVYDLSNGMVKTWSPIILGKTIEGIWHTAVIIYDMEYYYGGGIMCLDPSDFENKYTLKPVKIIDMGVTEVDQSIFHEYLNSIREQFSTDKYNIINWNCNHFTNEICNFLVGKNIPEYILNLPYEVMSTSQGKLILNMMQSYQTAIAPGFDNDAAGNTNTNAANTNAANTNRNTSTGAGTGVDNVQGYTKVPSVNMDNFFDDVDKNKIEALFNGLIKNSKYNADQKKNFFNAIYNCIDNIRMNSDNIKHRIVLKKNTNVFFKNISDVKEHNMILDSLGFHQALLETDKNKGLQKIVIFLDTKNRTKLHEHLDLLINKDLFLKENSKANCTTSVIQLKHAVDYIPYLEQNVKAETDDAYVFISMSYINEVINLNDVNNDAEHFNTLKEKIKIHPQEEKNRLTLLLDITKRFANMVN